MNPMPTFPNLPTDNLYKFFAISGLFIVILSVTIPYFQEHDLATQAIQIQQDEAILSKELKYLQTEIDIAIDKGEILDLQNYVFEKLKALDIKVTELDTKKKLLQNLENELTNLSKYRTVGVSIGVAILIIGFSLWYYCLQRYQDLIIKLQAVEMQSKNIHKP
jgi:uncharacterized membrane protein